MSDVAVTLAASGRRLLRPPRAELQLSVRLENRAAAPAWVVLPDDLSDADQPGSRLSALDRYELDGGALQLVHGLGEGGCFVLCLPASGTLALSALPLAYWGTIPPEVTVRLVVASRVLVDGLPLEELVVAMADCAASAGPVDTSPLADQRAVVQALQPPAGARFSLTFANPDERLLTVATR